MGWRESLEVLRGQFEAQAARSRGLHHLMVEVADDAPGAPADDRRNKLAGPDWFVAEAGIWDHGAATRPPTEGPWHGVQGGTLPGVSPWFREVRSSESLHDIADHRIVRDLSGAPRAIFEPQRVRFGYLCGDSNTLKAFESLAAIASRALVGAVGELEMESARDAEDLFRTPRGGIRYTFGTVTNPPEVFIARGWSAGILANPDGVLIDVPISESVPGSGHWLLLLHRLAWRGRSPLYGRQLAWHENMTVPYEWVVEREFDHKFPEQIRERFSQIPTTAYYSILGERDHPLDVNLASVFAIDVLLTAKSQIRGARRGAGVNVDYTREEWLTIKPPVIVEAGGSATYVKRRFKPTVILLTATPLERDTVLKHLDPLPDSGGVIRVFHENNTFFLGRLGRHAVVLCMCSAGASGRDSAQIVTAEVLRFWKSAALIMVGIAFGRGPDRQKIGDVLVSERIIAYEPERIGSAATITRGQEFLPSARLYNSFRNADVDWCFRDPTGSNCTPHFGSLLSGEKLIDDPSFKTQLFEKHPTAIGGEMEGVGVAACAMRQKRDWILVKSICDWADGMKSDLHQGFAAAAAVSFVRHVLSQAGTVSGK